MSDEKNDEVEEELEEHQDGDFTVGQVVGGALRHDLVDDDPEDYDWEERDRD